MITTPCYQWTNTNLKPSGIGAEFSFLSDRKNVPAVTQGGDGVRVFWRHKGWIVKNYWEDAKGIMFHHLHSSSITISNIQPNHIVIFWKPRHSSNLLTYNGSWTENRKHDNVKMLNSFGTLCRKRGNKFSTICEAVIWMQEGDIEEKNYKLNNVPDELF